jgi:hypothetical protein
MSNGPFTTLGSGGGGNALSTTSVGAPVERSLLDQLNSASVRLHEILGILEGFSARIQGMPDEKPSNPGVRPPLPLKEVTSDLEGGIDAAYHGLCRIIKFIGV